MKRRKKRDICREGKKERYMKRRKKREIYEEKEKKRDI